MKILNVTLCRGYIIVYFTMYMEYTSAVNELEQYRTFDTSNFEKDFGFGSLQISNF